MAPRDADGSEVCQHIRCTFNWREEVRKFPIFREDMRSVGANFTGKNDTFHNPSSGWIFTPIHLKNSQSCSDDLPSDEETGETLLAVWLHSVTFGVTGVLPESCLPPPYQAQVHLQLKL